MIILHAGISGNQFMLWGETDAESAVSPRNKTSKTRFPYDPGSARLIEALSAVLPEFKKTKGSAKQLTALLPSIDGQPIASSPLIAEPPASVPGAAATLTPWRVTAIPLTTTEAVDLLSLCMNEAPLLPGVVAGSDLDYWAQVCRYAGSLVAREQFLPGVEKVDGTYRSCWQPIFAVQETHVLAEAMPHVCRALSEESDIGSTSSSAIPAISLFKGFVRQIVDWFVRSAADLSNVSAGKPGRKSESESFDSLHDQWLHSLGNA